ncbi:MAG: 50S ribosomal protein L10 [bacterium]|nr:50S ribosomal protein L10 [bacterium]
MKKAEKPAFVTEIAARIKKAKSVVAVNYQGISVKDMTKLRQDIAAAGGQFQVIKNTLVKLALEEAGALEKDQVTTDGELLMGPTALVFAANDEIAPLQLLGKATTDTPLKLKFGVFNVGGKHELYETIKLSVLSKLPGKQVLQGKVVGSLMGPLYGLVGTLRGNLQSLVYILNAKAQKI